MQKMKTIFEILVYIIILAIFVLVGSPLTYNCIIINIVLIAIGLILVIYKKFIKRQKIIENKQDLFMLIFYASSLIPLVFGTYINLEETLKAIIIYFSLLSLYFILKEILISNNKSANKLANIVIIGGVIFSLFGIDELTQNIFKELWQNLHIPVVSNAENRMVSSFGYANSFAVFIAASLMLTISKIGENKKTTEFALGLTFIFMASLLLSYSRAVILVSAIIGILYIITLKKEKKIDTIYLIVFNILLAILYGKIFETLQTAKLYNTIYLVTVIFYLISVLLSALIKKCHNYIVKIKTKNYIITIIIAIISIFVIYLIGLTLDKPYEIFGSNTDTRSARFDLFDVQANTDYEFVFDIEACSSLENKDNYSIAISEENKYYETIERHTINFNNYTGPQTISFTSKDETKKMVIYLYNNAKGYQQGLKINSVYINGKKHPLNYAYLPVKLVEKIQGFSFSNKNVWERFVFIKDGFKIAIHHPFTGIGGKGWLYSYENVQEYEYSSTEVHSFIVQIFIDNGIIAVASLVAILVCLIIKIIKQRKTHASTYAFLILTLHSFIDFDMSFYCNMVLWIILLLIASQSNNRDIS